MDRKINAAAFKARCLALIDEVAESGEPITVTKCGKAKVRVVAVREEPRTLIGATKGTFRIVGDIVGPIVEDLSHPNSNKAAVGISSSLSAEIAMVAAELEGMHGDQIDRIIVMTALAHDAVLLTADRLILDWPGDLHRQDACR